MTYKYGLWNLSNRLTVSGSCKPTAEWITYPLVNGAPRRRWKFSNRRDFPQARKGGTGSSYKRELVPVEALPFDGQFGTPAGLARPGAITASSTRES